MTRAHCSLRGHDLRRHGEVQGSGVAAHDGDGEGVEGTGLDEGGIRDAGSDRFAHLVGRPPREGQGEYPLGPDAPVCHQVGDPRHEHTCFARARSGEHEQRSSRVLDGPELVGVEGWGRCDHTPSP